MSSRYFSIRILLMITSVVMRGVPDSNLRLSLSSHVTLVTIVNLFPYFQSPSWMVPIIYILVLLFAIPPLIYILRSFATSIPMMQPYHMVLFSSISFTRIFFFVDVHNFITCHSMSSSFPQYSSQKFNLCCLKHVCFVYCLKYMFQPHKLILI